MPVVIVMIDDYHRHLDSRYFYGGRKGTRTPDPLGVNEVL